MSNVFKYPNTYYQPYSWINSGDIYLGALQRANYYLNHDNTNYPYTKQYLGETATTDRFAGLNPRTPAKMLEKVSLHRQYYGHFSDKNSNNYPSYESIYTECLIDCYFHEIKGRSTSSYPEPTTGTLRINCKRDANSHPNNSGDPTKVVPINLSSPDTHGLGNSITPYHNLDPIKVQFSGYDTSVPGEWGNYLNFADNGGTYFYLKVINSQTVEVYTDSGYTTPVNIGPSGLNWGAYIHDLNNAYVISDDSTYRYQLINVTFVDRGNRVFTYYDKDYYSGYGNSVNNNFGANIVGARPFFYVKTQPIATAPNYNSNLPMDYASYAEWWYDSQYLPGVTIQCAGDGLPYTGVGNNGCVTGVTFDEEFCGRFASGGTAADPFDGVGEECALSVATLDSDPAAGYTFFLSNVTQANPAVVTFANSVFDQSATSEFSMKTFRQVGGMTELDGLMVYLKSTGHNTAELYYDHNFTSPVDSTGFSAYTGSPEAGDMADFDNNSLQGDGVFSPSYTGDSLGSDFDNYNPQPLSTTNAGSSDQVWPRTVSPAKMDIQLIQPTRKTYGQDLTRYTNSTGAYGYRLTLTYNNISKDAWREFDGFIKGMRGATAPFHFYYFNNTDGGGYRVFDSSQDTIDTWEASRIALAKPVSAGDTKITFTGFKADGSAPGTNTRIVSRTNDVFFAAHTYRDSYTANNVGFAGGEFQTNQFGEAIIRFTHPFKNTLSALNNSITPTRGWTYLQCMLADDEVEYDFHPIGDFVSFKVDLDVV